MKNHFDLSDEAFEKQFESLSLEPSLFSHEAHLRLAWIHITRYGIDRATNNVCRQIKRFATANGAPDKYNRTVTEAAVRTVYHFYLKSPGVDFQTLIHTYPRLRDNFIGLLRAHYSFDIFTDATAKQVFQAPDLLPYD